MILPTIVLALALQQSHEPTCSAEVMWSGPDQITASRSAPWRTVTLFSAVSNPSNICLPAEMRLTAMYFDANDDLICSGVVPEAARQGSATQSTTLELRFSNPFEFARWRSGPRAVALRWLPFQCTRPDGTGDATQGELERAVAVRLYATVLPSGSGVASQVLRVQLIP